MGLPLRALTDTHLMSIKIYDGFELQNCSLEQALEHLKALRPAAHLKARQLVAQEVVQRATLAWDAGQHGVVAPSVEQNPGVSYLFAAALHVADEQEEVRRIQCKNPAVDVSLSVCLIPLKDRLLGVVYGVRSDMRELITLLPGYAALPYWDNEDPPEGVSDESWEQRGRDWADALPGWGAPAEVGLTYELVSELARHSLDYSTVELVAAAQVPAPTARASALLDLLYDHGKTDLPAATTTRAARLLLASPAWSAAKAALAEALPTLDVTVLMECPDAPAPVTSAYVPDLDPEPLA